MQAEPAFQAAEVFWMEMLVSTAFFSLLAAVSVRDIWYREVSDRLQAGIVMTACLRVLFLNVSPCYILGGFILVPYLVAALCGKEGKGIGGGDIKLMAAAGVCLGPEKGTVCSLFWPGVWRILWTGADSPEKAKKRRGHSAWPLFSRRYCGGKLIFFSSIKKLIPSHHREAVVNALGEQNLVNVDDTVVECGGTGIQIKIPHP